MRYSANLIVSRCMYRQLSVSQEDLLMEPVADKNNGQAKRARGVQASPAKIRAALLAAGIKSQTELAKLIQLNEGLDKPPRSLVNRVCSGEQVDILSLERVAKALNTEAWTLYLSSTDADTGEIHSASESAITTHVQGWRPAKILALLSASVLLVLIAGYQYSYRTVTPADAVQPASVLELERKLITVLPFQGDESNRLTPLLEQALAHYSSTLPGSAARFASTNPLQVLADKHADLVFTGESRLIGRHMAIRVLLYQRNGMQQIWAGTLAASSSDTVVLNQFTTVIAQARQNLASLANPDWALTLRYTDSLHYFELDRTEQNLLRLNNELSAIVRLDSTYTDANAALCSALIQQSILNGSTEPLQEAQHACDRAAALNPEAISVLQAQANLARKQGDTERATALLQQILSRDSDNVTAKFVLAEVLIQQYRKTGESSYITQAVTLLTQATTTEPGNWKLPYTLGRAYYFIGDVDTAIIWSDKAATLRPEFQTHNNLGTMYFCKGDLNAAKQHYLSALSYHPEHDIVLANIATLHYYLEEYQQAIAIFNQRIQSLEQQGSDQQYNIWMNLANAYRHTGAIEPALLAYQKALNYIEHIIAKGEANHLQRAIRVAIYLDIALLQPEQVSPQLRQSLREEALALDSAAEPTSLHMMALIWLYLGDMEKAAQLRQRLAGNCPGFVASPDFAPLNAYLNTNTAAE